MSLDRMISCKDAVAQMDFLRREVMEQTHLALSIRSIFDDLVARRAIEIANLPVPMPNDKLRDLIKQAMTDDPTVLHGELTDWDYDHLADIAASTIATAPGSGGVDRGKLITYLKTLIAHHDEYEDKCKSVNDTSADAHMNRRIALRDLLVKLNNGDFDTPQPGGPTSGSFTADELAIIATLCNESLEHFGGYSSAKDQRIQNVIDKIKAGIVDAQPSVCKVEDVVAKYGQFRQHLRCVLTAHELSNLFDLESAIAKLRSK